MESNLFVVETEFNRLPDALKQKPIIQTGALAISEVNQIDPTDKTLYLGKLYASEMFKKARLTGIATDLYGELAAVYRDIYGNAPWNEFLVCSQAGCSGKKSISDVYGLSIEYQPSLNELEARNPTIPEDHKCPTCGSPMRFYYPSSKILSMIDREFSDDIVATFIYDSKGIMSGFSWAWFGNANEITQKLQDQLKCTNDSPVINATQNYLRENGLQHVLFWNEWAVAYAYRKTIGSLLLIRYISFIGKDRAAARNDMEPIFLGTALKDSNAYKLYCEFGAQTIVIDPITKVAVMSNPVQRGIDQCSMFEEMLTKRLSRKREDRLTDIGHDDTRKVA
jgi:hypothetical protein